MITDYEASVLAHTWTNGRFVTGEMLVIEMGERGLLFDHGAQRIAGGMHYLTLTVRGREALNEWRAAQPKPPRRKRRRISPAFESWRSYCDSFERCTFSEFLKEVWPRRREWNS